MRTLRVAAVPYLNIEPFLDALARTLPCAVTRACPAELASLHAEGSHDLCMLPAADILRLGLQPLGKAAISSKGAVGSVLLISRLPPRRWCRVALDAASSTSASLARLLLPRLGAPPARIEAAPNPFERWQRGLCDAALVIGDRALSCPVDAVRLDLGQAWAAATGLPFVYAAWVPGPGSKLGRERLEQALREARARSRHYAAAAALRHAASSGLPYLRLARYLTEQISYDFGARERRGMDLFGGLLLERASLAAAGGPA
jgi:predicted solute-binding protein